MAMRSKSVPGSLPDHSRLESTCTTCFTRRGKPTDAGDTEELDVSDEGCKSGADAVAAPLALPPLTTPFLGFRCRARMLLSLDTRGVPRPRGRTAAVAASTTDPPSPPRPAVRMAVTSGPPPAAPPPPPAARDGSVESSNAVTASPFWIPRSGPAGQIGRAHV